ncbi:MULTISPECIES: bifunctional ADP-dependent NAD(P)H-hydrate dehydratase/NAD(P)H-hydrate epimerase [Tepidanaerobacter]|uniref:Bifunctional NAD(P)H-hydrate repair enzyme n=1 Tax=Tepidanaerobacter syntrophicus TaxID=224999 RepID=A0A0U9HFG3_9FIRM|nr:MULTISPECIES: bifunctional ADP-dependent NAD(P)H-hydrate dehydratase/NAD(P)H-hydrate epimerase [Tepidanaerobacter]GAQ25254.1 NAD(P)H-hydrate epimerase [Tepidanaerobacter syntrophicus]
MKVVSPVTMRKMDQMAIEEYKVPGAILMENAGREVALAAKNLFERKNSGMSANKAKIAVFCGKGNNGGDGFVAARHLSNMGFGTTIYLIANPEDIIGDAGLNLKIVEEMELPIEIIGKSSDLSSIEEKIKESSIIIDAIFGTGLKGEVKGIARDVIELINSLKIPVIAVDIPSGISGESGKVLGTAIKAEETVTMGALKTGLLLYPGAEYAGNIKIADIGMPKIVEESIEAEAELLEDKWVASCFKAYPPDAHKGTFGKVFIIAGSQGMTGAAALSATAAVRSGAGLVTVGIPKSLDDILETKLTEAMKLPLAETSDRCLSLDALNTAIEFASTCNAVVLGPGISQKNETKKFVQQFILKCPVPIVIDADGLNALADNPDILKDISAPVIITPHPGEMGRLLNMTSAQIQEDRIGAARTAAKRFGCVAVLKGARTLIATPSNELFINPTGNPGMATGGSGDVLSGMIGAFLARGMEPHEAAASAVYLHGLAGDFAALDKTEIYLSAGDIINYLYKAFYKIKKEHQDV